MSYEEVKKNMGVWDIQPSDDWFRRFFSSIPFFSRTGSTGEWLTDMPSRFDQMRREMERAFQEQFRDIETKVPKELVREYQTPEGSKIREVGPLVYGYSMTIGPDGKPRVKEFGNLRSPLRGGGSFTRPLISGETEPFADVTSTENEIKVVVEMPGIDKKDIKINAYDSSVEVSTLDGAKKKYRSVIELPPEADIETAKSIYNNGILEITFKKKEKLKGKEVKVE
jgi:HSP20 family protein